MPPADPAAVTIFPERRIRPPRPRTHDPEDAHLVPMRRRRLIFPDARRSQDQCPEHTDAVHEDVACTWRSQSRTSPPT